MVAQLVRASSICSASDKGLGSYPTAVSPQTESSAIAALSVWGIHRLAAQEHGLNEHYEQVILMITKLTEHFFALLIQQYE